MFSLILAATSSASPTYPGAIEDAAGIPCTPQCILCHEDNAGGVGTANAPFGVAMRGRGLVGGSRDELVSTAFEAVSTSGSDVDGDGVSDADELAVGDDPNVEDGDLCTAASGGGGSGCATGGAAGWLVVAAAALLRRQR